MSFRNSILAGEQLIRTGIRSENYVAGVSGWRVDRNGDAEFNDVVVRGSFATGTGFPRIEILKLLGSVLMYFYPAISGPPATLQGSGLTSGVLAMTSGSGVGQVTVTAAGVSVVAYDGAALADGVLEVNGEDQLGAWTPYTPALTSVTLGNGTLAAAYKLIGTRLTIRMSLRWGTTTAFTGTPSFGLPFVALSGLNQTIGAHLLDSGAKEYPASARAPGGGGSFSVYHPALAGTGNLSATAPFTWAVNDLVLVGGTLEIDP